MLQTFESLISINNARFEKKTNELIKFQKIFSENSGASSLDLDPDFLHSVILHSNAGYLLLASQEKCRFYDTILTDLLRSAEGRIKNIIVTYLNSKGVRETAIIAKKDFLTRIVNKDCPQTANLITQFQIKNLEETLKATPFDIPSGEQQCHSVLLGWLNNPKTPYLCQISEYMKDANAGQGDPQDLAQRRSLAKLLEQKLDATQQDYLDNLCQHLDDEELFCQDFLNVSFWNKVANGRADKIFAEEICKKALGTNSLNVSQLKQCLVRMKKESDICLYPTKSQGLSPQMECDSLSLALNYSSMRSNYQDGPAQSDQHIVTNVARIILNVTKAPVQDHAGPPSVISSGETLAFNTRYGNAEKWGLEACYLDKILEREVCERTFFGSYGAMPESYPNVISTILQRTRGADSRLKCEMVASKEYNPLLLKYKSGCYIIYEREQCFISECPNKILYNDRTISYISTRNKVNFDYFATNLRDERFTQHYLLTTDFKLTPRSLNNLSGIVNFYKRSKKGLIHGVGCGEDLLPSFFKSRVMNKCTPLPFIIDGMIREDNKTVFVTRTAYDSLQAPRLISWGQVFFGG